MAGISPGRPVSRAIWTPDLAGRLLAQIENLLPDDMRGPEGEAPFGPKVQVPGSAPAADRLAAFQGRHPWAGTC
jgi:hypothetical protein